MTDCLDIPDFLRRRSTGAAQPMEPPTNEITLRLGASRKRRKAPQTCAALRALGYSNYAIARMNRADGELIAIKQTRNGD